MLDIIKTGSYEGTTNIYTDEDVKPTIGVDYYKKGQINSSPLYIDFNKYICYNKKRKRRAFGLISIVVVLCEV